MTKKTYSVCGIHPILGVAPGGDLVAELSEAHEARLISLGAIKPKAKKKATTKSPTPAADAAEPEE